MIAAVTAVLLSPCETRGQATEAQSRAAARLQAAGFAPAGDRRTFYIEEAVAEVRLDQSRAELRIGDTVIVHGIDFVPLTGPSVMPFPQAATVRNGRTTFGGVLGSSRAVPPAAVRGRAVVFLPPVTPEGAPIYEVWQYPELFEPYYTKDSVSVIFVVGLDLMPVRAVEWLHVSHTAVRRRTGRLDLPPVVMVSRPAATMLIGWEYDNLAPGELGLSQHSSFPVAFDLRYALSEQKTLPPARAVVGERGTARGAPVVLVTGQPVGSESPTDERWAEIAAAMASDASRQATHIVAARVDSGAAGDVALTELLRRHAGYGTSPQLHIHVTTLRDVWSGGPCLGLSRRARQAIAIDPSVPVATALAALSTASTTAVSAARELAPGVWQCPVQAR
jgi:hypothetical protein